MEFGKLASVDGVDFGLPPDPIQNRDFLANCARGKPTLYLGATGYNMKPWTGKWYPERVRDKDMLTWYGQQFNTIEHNTTHYRIPDAATVARWREETPADFRFCPKIPQSVSHSRDLGYGQGELELFVEQIAGLGDRLGCCFLQLPPYFSVQQVAVIGHFLRRWPSEVPLALEFRHPSFFEPTVEAETCFQWLSEYGVAAVITDVAGRRDVCHMRLTAPRAMVRFVGNGLHPSDFTRIERWAERLRDWTAAGIREVYFFTHEPDNLLAPDLAEFAAATFARLMPDAQVRGPRPLPPPPRQGALFD